MTALWVIAVLIFLLGIAESAFLPFAILLIIGLSVATLVRRNKSDEITKSLSLYVPPANSRPKPPPVAPINIVEPYTCKSCGASNPGGAFNICDFCGAAAPVSRKAPPPVPGVSSAPVVADDSIGVSSSGWVCRSCMTYVSIPTKEMPGSALLEVILWFFYILPGVFYTMWRRNDANAIKVCALCKSHDFVPVSSPEGRSMFQRKYARQPRFN